MNDPRTRPPEFYCKIENVEVGDIIGFTHYIPESCNHREEFGLVTRIEAPGERRPKGEITVKVVMWDPKMSAWRFKRNFAYSVWVKFRNFRFITRKADEIEAKTWGELLNP